MSLRWLAFIWLALAGPLAADPVVVRSGEHPGFARLVLTFPDDPGWSFGRTPDGYELRTVAKGLRYDLSGVFARIRRDRLGAIWVDPASGYLRLGLRCTCHATAFSLRPRVVVIDLIDGLPVPGQGFEVSLDRPDAGPLPPLVGRVPARPRARPQETAGAGPPWPTADRPPVPFLPTLPGPAVAALQSEVLLAIAAATSRGDLQPAPGRRAEARDTQASHPTTLPVADEPASFQIAGPLRLDFRTAAADAALPVATRGGACIPDEALDLPGWFAADPPVERIAALRRGLLGEFDRPQTEAVLALARTYLAAGFGHEARQLLRAFAPEDPWRPVAETIAIVLETAPRVPAATETAAAFAGMESCDQRAALWAVLAGGRAGRDANRPAILRSFAELPPHLRHLLGPALAGLFLDSGDVETARALRDSMVRAEAAEAPGTEMVAARVKQMAGRQGEAEEGLRNVTAAGSELGITAALRLVESITARGGAPDPQLLAQIGALYHQHRRGPDGPALRRGFALATAASGDFSSALDRIAAQDPEARRAVWELLAARPEPAALIAVALGGPDRRAGLRPETALALSEALLSLGFPEAAEAWTAGLGTERARLLRGRGAVARGDTRAALRQIAGDASVEADELRAEAFSRVARDGPTDPANPPGGAMDRSNEQRPADTHDPRGGPDRTPRADTLRLPEPEGKPRADQPPPLARARQSLEASRRAREQTTRVLSALPDPAQAD
ncbi:MAG: hypothetical protein ACK4KW_04635 [Gemmobacter sp.]